MQGSSLFIKLPLCQLNIYQLFTSAFQTRPVRLIPNWQEILIPQMIRKWHYLSRYSQVKRHRPFSWGPVESTETLAAKQSARPNVGGRFNTHQREAKWTRPVRGVSVGHWCIEFGSFVIVLCSEIGHLDVSRSVCSKYHLQSQTKRSFDLKIRLDALTG